MTEEEVRQSGLWYVECPICNHIVPIATSSNAEGDIDVHIYCSTCDRNFYGIQRTNPEILLWDKPNYASFEKPIHRIFYKKNRQPITSHMEV